MKKSILPQFPFFITAFSFLLMNNPSANAQNPVIDSVVALSAQVDRYGKFECIVYLKAAVANPYDYDEAVVQGIFTGPDGQSVSVDGFFMQDYSLNAANGNLSPLGSGAFRVRFCPAQTGTWMYTVKVTTASGVASAPQQNFTCQPSAKKGFIRRSAGNYFQFDAGEQYIPIGQNVCWQNNNVYLDYKNWLGDMVAAGANFYRLWMAHWGLGIEWKNNSSGFSGLKKYKQTSSYYIDWMLDYGAENNLYLMLCINHHGQYSTTVNPNWNENPYSAALGGPISQPQQFFSDLTARKLHKNRLRYIVARWGYSTNIQCWELFNEVDLTENFGTNSANVVSWHDEMSAYLKSIDPYQHLVSTSGSSPGAFDDIWDLPGIDFTQEHIYRNVANIEEPVVETARSLINNFGKPALVGEFGLSGSGTQTAADDPSGIHLHNGMWGGLFSGSAGTAMTWWWDNYVEPKNLYPVFTPLATVANQISLATGQFKPVTPKLAGGPASDAVFAPAAGWTVPTASQFTVDASGKLTPGVTELGQYLYGSTWNTQFRNPPQFTVTFPAASKFRVRSGAHASTAPKVVIYLDGNEVLNQNGTVNTDYSINVPAGQHTIKVDNLGTDWIEIAEYVFEKIGSSVTAFTLQSADKSRTVGWLLNKQYNWQYLKNTGTPPAIDGVTVTIPGMTPGAYQLKWWECGTGSILNSISLSTDASGNLTLPCPSILWDLAFTAEAGVVEVTEAETTTAEVFYPSPVPADGMFTWETGEAEPGVWVARFFNTQGQVVKQQNVTVPGGTTVSLSAAGLPAGLFFVVLENGNSLRRGKVMVGIE